MHEWDDNALLREYVERDSEEAFAALVTRHVNKVYSVALRQAGNPHAAEEITQAVFVILARKSRRLGRRVILSGWLYQTARLTAVTFVRGEIRRARREQEAHMQTELNQTESGAWPHIAPLLEGAMASLNESDRHAVVLRFFDGKSLKEVGAALGANEDAAKKRVQRAVEKLRRFFAKRGVLLPAAALTAAISAHSVQAAPVTLAGTVTAVALAKGAAASGSTLTLITRAMKLMAWTKTKTTALVSIGLILIFTGGTAIIISKRQAAHWRAATANAYQRSNLNQPNYRALLANLRAGVWPRERHLAEAKINSRQQSDETTHAVTIDLKPYVNCALTDSPASPIGNNNNNLAELPYGRHVFGGVPFDVAGLIQLDGTSMLVFKKHFPVEMDQIRINRRCAKIYLFHGANFIYPMQFGQTVAQLVLHYADGSTREIEIVAGRHVFDCWSPLFTTGVDPRYFEMDPGTERAWTGSNPFIKRFWPDESLILYKSTFDNPQPDAVVANVDYVSTMTGTGPFLVGLTVE